MNQLKNITFKTISNVLINSKKGYVFSILAIFIGILMYTFFQVQLQSTNYLDRQESIDSRVFQLDREYTFFRNSILPQLVRYSVFSSTNEFYDLLIGNEILRASFDKDYSNFQSSLVSATVFGQISQNIEGFESSIVLDGMENKTLPYLIEFYEDFFNNSLQADLTYEIISLRVYESIPMYINVDLEINLSLTSKELDFEIYDENYLVRTSFSIEGLKDPQVALYANNLTAEPLRLEKDSPIYEGNWTPELFNVTFNEGLVTTFEYPEFRYSLGTSFIRSMLNSTNRGVYGSILSFLSFEYNMNATPYDTANFNTTHRMYGTTIFISSFDNISNIIDESSYNSDFSVNCNEVSGVRGTGCSIADSEGLNVTDLSLDSSSFGISVWINYSSTLNSPRILLQTENFTVTLIPQIQSIVFEGTTTEGSFIRNNISFRAGRWNNLIITPSSDRDEMLLLVNSEIRYFNPVVGYFPTIEEVKIGDVNIEIDEVVIVNKTLRGREISILNTQRAASFIEYQESLYEYGFNFFNKSEFIELNLSNRLNQTFDEFTIEFWYRFDEDSQGGQLLFFENSSTNEFFELNLIPNFINLSGVTDTNSFSIQTSPIQNLFSSRYTHLLIQINSSRGVEIFLNSELVFSQNSFFSGNLGRYDIARIGSSNSNFIGVLDEFVLYDSNLLSHEIVANFYNFKSEVGGCCNYFKMYNEDTHQLGNPFIRNALPTIFLTNLEEFSSYNVILTNRSRDPPSNDPWEGNNFDACQIYIFNMDTFSRPYSVVSGDVGERCFDLIKAGIY